MSVFIDLTGQRFGRLVVRKRSPENDRHGCACWVCDCDCGSMTVPLESNLRRGNSQSCGCLTKEGAELGFAHRIGVRIDGERYLLVV